MVRIFRMAALAVLTAGFASAADVDTWSRAEAKCLLVDWADGLIACQQPATARSEFRGGMLCPACGFMHGRICDVVLPFTYLWRETGERKYLDAAVLAIDWCEANLVDSEYGLYKNDRQTLWRCTTVFFQRPLARTLMKYGDVLPADVAAKWRSIFARASHAIHRYFENPCMQPVVNYNGACAESMALAWKLLGEEKFAEMARRQAAHVKTLVGTDGLLWGEGPRPHDGTAPGGSHYVDLGYNCEETLAALAGYAELMDDGEMRALVRRMGRAHAAFILPDGGLDNSMGSRSVKWTYYGSRTSDGILPLLLALAPAEPWTVRAVDRTLKMYRRCTLKDGLLAGGLMYGEAGEPACTHHAFAHAKAIAELLLSDLPESAPAAELPRERADRADDFPSIRTHLASVGPWRATFTANDGWNIDARAAVGGGSCSLLWHGKLGPVLAGTLIDFFFAEPMNMQESRHDTRIRSTMPRLEADGATNVRDRFAQTSFAFADGVAAYGVKAHLVDKRGTPGAACTFDYRLDGHALAIAASCEKAAVFRLPVIVSPTDEIRAEGGRVAIRRAAGTVVVESSLPAVIEGSEYRPDRFFTPVGGFVAAGLTYHLPANAPFTCRISVE